MSDNDALADLGLDLGTENTAGSAAAVNPDAPAVSDAVVAETVAAGEAAAPVDQTTAAARAPREEVAIAEIETGFADFIPAQKRGGSSGSKYSAFDDLVAPELKDAADPSKGFKYATATVKPEDATNFDEGKLTRSVQSAVTAANRAAKDAGSPNRYVTRRAVKEGVFVGVTVFRVDGTLDTEAEDNAAA